MQNLFSKKDKGFTLVEIIIVLAIVGLIFVIIFLAVDSAQRGRRDTARKDNVHRLIAAIHQYASNNNGSYPTPDVSLSGFTVSDPVTSICNPSGCRTRYILGWLAGPCPSSTTGATTGRVIILLEDGVTTYCKDY